MGSFEPISEENLIKLINSSIYDLTGPELVFYEAIRIAPQKWELEPWGKEGGGFWVIGLIGQTVLWYNDIEEGFNDSQYSEYGVIGEYWCNQDDFALAVRNLKSFVETCIPPLKMSPPIPIS